jgi:hypothetical protein
VDVLGGQIFVGRAPDAATTKAFRDMLQQRKRR